MQKIHTKRLTHAHFGNFLKDAVFGANDGIISTFAVVAAVAGAALSPITVVIVGLANLFADAFSMATSNYLGTKSDLALYRRERSIEEREVEEIPKEEEAEIKKILIEKGYWGEELEQMIRLMMKNKKFWVDFMMSEELGFGPARGIKPIKSGITTFVSFAIAGFLPISPYLFARGVGQEIFLYSLVATALALFFAGSLRSFFTGKYWFLSGLEMLFFGGIAAAIAYGIGYMAGGIM